MCLCTCIVCCNLSVIRVLCDMGKRMISRRYSGSSCRSTSSRCEPLYNNATPEELSFARLMAVLSIFFVICWVPQLVTIIAAQHSLLQSKSHIYRAADVLIALNFTLDPYLYVLFRRKQSRRKNSRANTTTRKFDFRKGTTTTPKTLVTNESVASTNGERFKH
ncbi:hypothetical protein Anas_04862 [Armadillidium nasatum]|uniref:G-protein coupled receptors family 1 profile domain-containing protein n=1 Tax=Armadillidium nasatum TaxID=96803 RepID=A0A5N5TB66_9CRUS|nr:hypothetical protein Anas_04862 [Armadillidium nasatum]